MASCLISYNTYRDDDSRFKLLLLDSEEHCLTAVKKIVEAKSNGILFRFYDPDHFDQDIFSFPFDSETCSVKLYQIGFDKSPDDMAGIYDNTHCGFEEEDEEEDKLLELEKISVRKFISHYIDWRQLAGIKEQFDVTEIVACEEKCVNIPLIKRIVEFLTASSMKPHTEYDFFNADMTSYAIATKK